MRNLNKAHQEAKAEIERALNEEKVTWLRRAQSIAISLAAFFFQIWVILAFITLAYKGVQFSREHLPLYLHIVVLFIYIIALVVGISAIVTERKRWQWSDNIWIWLGPRGMIILPALIIFSAAGVFASFSYIFYESGMMAFEPCQGSPVTEAKLLDFYIWHFLKLIPFLKINEILRRAEPLCYTQSRVGFMVLLFQGFVVFPSIASIRFYWKNWDELGGQRIEYIFDPNISSPGFVEPKNLNRVVIHPEASLTRTQIEAVIHLDNLIWPGQDKTEVERVEDLWDQVKHLRESVSRSYMPLRFVIWEEARAIAHAHIFPRQICTESGSLQVGALASVCVDPEYRGQGLGTAIVVRVFELIDGATIRLRCFKRMSRIFI